MLRRISDKVDGIKSKAIQDFKESIQHLIDTLELTNIEQKKISGIKTIFESKTDEQLLTEIESQELVRGLSLLSNSILRKIPEKKEAIGTLQNHVESSQRNLSSANIFTRKELEKKGKNVISEQKEFEAALAKINFEESANNLEARINLYQSIRITKDDLDPVLLQKEEKIISDLKTIEESLKQKTKEKDEILPLKNQLGETALTVADLLKQLSEREHELIKEKAKYEEQINEELKQIPPTEDEKARQERVLSTLRREVKKLEATLRLKEMLQQENKEETIENVKKRITEKESKLIAEKDILSQKTTEARNALADLPTTIIAGKIAEAKAYFDQISSVIEQYFKSIQSADFVTNKKAPTLGEKQIKDKKERLKIMSELTKKFIVDGNKFLDETFSMLKTQDKEQDKEQGREKILKREKEIKSGAVLTDQDLETLKIHISSPEEKVETKETKLPESPEPVMEGLKVHRVTVHRRSSAATPPESIRKSSADPASLIPAEPTDDPMAQQPMTLHIPAGEMRRSFAATQSEPTNTPVIKARS